MKLLEARVQTYDTMAPFIILYLIDGYALKVEDIWGDCSATGVKLFKHWSKISLQQEIIFQRDSYDHCIEKRGYC